MDNKISPPLWTSIFGLSCVLIILLSALSFRLYYQQHPLTKPITTDQTLPDNPSSWKTYTSPVSGFKIDLPSSWKILNDNLVILEVSNQAFNPDLHNGMTPGLGQVIVYFKLTHAALENYSSNPRYFISTEGVPVIELGKYIGPTGSFAVTTLYRQNDPQIPEFEQTISQILSTFKFKNSDDTSIWKTYNKNSYFKLKYPQGWFINYDLNNNLFISSTNPKLGGNFAGFKIEFNDPGKVFINTEFSSKSPMIIDGFPGYKLTPNSAPENLLSTEYYISRENLLFHFSLSEDLGFPERNEKEINDKILSTFKFISSGDTSTWKTYTDPENNYSIGYPDYIYKSKSCIGEELLLIDVNSELSTTLSACNRDWPYELEIRVSDKPFSEEISNQYYSVTQKVITLDQNPATMYTATQIKEYGPDSPQGLLWYIKVHFAQNNKYYEIFFKDHENLNVFNQVLSTIKF